MALPKTVVLHPYVNRQIIKLKTAKMNCIWHTEIVAGLTVGVIYYCKP